MASSLAGPMIKQYGGQFVSGLDLGGFGNEITNQASKMTADWMRSGHMASDVKNAAKTGGNWIQRKFYSTFGKNDKVKELENKQSRILTDWAFDHGTAELGKHLQGTDMSKNMAFNSAKEFMNNILNVREKMAKEGQNSPSVREMLKHIDFAKGNDAIKNSISLLSNQMTDDQNPLAPMISQAVSGLTKMLGVTNPAALAAISVAELLMTINPLRKGLTTLAKGIGKGLVKGAKWIWNKIRGNKVEHSPDAIQIFPQPSTNDQLLADLEKRRALLMNQYNLVPSAHAQMVTIPSQIPNTPLQIPSTENRPLRQTNIESFFGK